MDPTLQPGPFLMGTAADVSVGAVNYDFTDDAAGLYNELFAIYDGWEAFMDDLAALASQYQDPLLGIDETGLLTELAAEEKLASLPDLDTTIAAFNVADPLLQIAISFAPAAAWSNPTAAFVPPDPTATILVPTVNPAYFTADVTAPTSGQASTPAPVVTIQNLTRVGDQNYVVGDQQLITALGPPGQSITFDDVVNGVDYGTGVLGETLPDGTFSLQQTIGPEFIGGWIQTWWIGGVVAATYTFIVAPS